MKRSIQISTFLVFFFTCVNVFAQENFELPMPPEHIPTSAPSDIIQKPRSKATTPDNSPTVKRPKTEDLGVPEPPEQSNVFRLPQRKRPTVSKRPEKAIPRHIDTEPILPPALPTPTAERNNPN